MSHSILLVESETELRTLLTEILRQTGYSVTAAQDPNEAVAATANPFDLLIADCQLQNADGLECVDQIRQKQPNLPLFLLAEVIDGQFMEKVSARQPGNIFTRPLPLRSLLRKISEHFNGPGSAQPAAAQGGSQPAASFEAAQAGAPAAAATATAAPQATAPQQAQTPTTLQENYRFISNAYTSPAAKNITRQLIMRQNFRNCLTLEGRPGAAFEPVCLDISSFPDNARYPFQLLMPEQIIPERLGLLVEQFLNRGQDQVTFIIPNADTLAAPQAKALVALTNHEPPFQNLQAIAVRFILCTNQELDTLLGSGAIDQDFYLFLAKNEIPIPSMVSMKDDLPLLASIIVRWRAAEKGIDPVPQLDAGAQAFLTGQPWAGDYMEFAAVVGRAFLMAGGQEITAAHLEKALAFAQQPQE